MVVIPSLVIDKSGNGVSFLLRTHVKSPMKNYNIETRGIIDEVLSDDRNNAKRSRFRNEISDREIEQEKPPLLCLFRIEYICLKSFNHSERRLRPWKQLEKKMPLPF
jgi:hypothetical protein